MALVKVCFNASYCAWSPAELMSKNTEYPTATDVDASRFLRANRLLVAAVIESMLTLLAETDGPKIDATVEANPVFWAALQEVVSPAPESVWVQLIEPIETAFSELVGAAVGAGDTRAFDEIGVEWVVG